MRPEEAAPVRSLGIVLGVQVIGGWVFPISLDLYCHWLQGSVLGHPVWLSRGWLSAPMSRAPLPW